MHKADDVIVQQQITIKYFLPLQVLRLSCPWEAVEFLKSEDCCWQPKLDVILILKASFHLYVCKSKRHPSGDLEPETGVRKFFM